MTEISANSALAGSARPAAMPESGGLLRLVPVVFVLTLAVPVVFEVGPLALLPHRAFILVAFFPLLIALLAGAAGRIMAIDWLILFSTGWAMIALAVNPGSNKIEAMGIYGIEFFGAYLVGRVSVRNASDFLRFAGTYFLVLLVLLPFTAAESFLHRTILLDLIPNSVKPANSGPRFGLARAQGPFAHAIIYGVFGATAFGLFWHILRPNFLRFLGVGVSFASTFFSLSTGALIAFVMQFIFIAWEMITHRIPWRWRLFAFLTALAYVTVDLLSNRTPFHVLVSYASFNTGSAYGRILIWQHGMVNVWDNPIFGMGLNNVNWIRPVWMLTSVDNYWLLTAMTYGLPSVFALMAAVILILWRVADADLREDRFRRIRAGFLTSLGGLIIAGGTVHYWHAMQAFVMFFVGAGIWLINASGQGGEDFSPSQQAEGAGRSIRYTRFDGVRPRQARSHAGDPTRTDKRIRLQRQTEPRPRQR